MDNLLCLDGIMLAGLPQLRFGPMLESKSGLLGETVKKSAARNRLNSVTLRG